MTKSTSPVFVVGTGRNGTRSLFRMLRGNSKIEAHHEYGCESIQKISCLYSMGLMSTQDATHNVFSHYWPAINHSHKKIWLDSSNKASWVIDVLSNVFPCSRFIHIVRDPRRVVPSYYYKLREEMYDPQSVAELISWVNNGCSSHDILPSEKKYWWRIELDEFLKVSQSEHSRTRFERVCLHWREATKTISNAFKNLDAHRSLTLRLEDLVSNETDIKKLLSFLDLPFSDFYLEFLQKPRNVFLPLEFNCTQNQLDLLQSICSEQADSFGYKLSDPIPSIHY